MSSTAPWIDWPVSSRRATSATVSNMMPRMPTAASAAQAPRASAPAASAPLDAAKVARVRAAVLDGSYKPDAGRIAQRMLDLERKLP